VESSRSSVDPRRWGGSALRRLASAATGARLDGVEAALGEVRQHLLNLEFVLAKNALEVEALRQQVDECRDFLEVQHDVLRDVLRRLDPPGDTGAPGSSGT
jgi:hypothetical protein